MKLEDVKSFEDIEDYLNSLPDEGEAICEAIMDAINEMGYEGVEQLMDEAKFPRSVSVEDVTDYHFNEWPAQAQENMWPILVQRGIIKA